MATIPVTLSMDEYLRTSYKPDVDFVDGEREERNLGKYEHAKIQGLIATLFNTNEDAWEADAVVEQRIRVSAKRVRICDVAVLRADAPLEEVTATPPLICIEILLPEDRLARAEIVLGDYREMGVANIWLIDPMRRVAYTFGEGGLQRADAARLSVAGTAIEMDLAALFARLDRKMGVREE